MPRHTRNQPQRRLDAYTQRRSERRLRQLSGELRVLWRQHETANNSEDQDTEYVDPKLTLRSPDGSWDGVWPHD